MCRSSLTILMLLALLCSCTTPKKLEQPEAIVNSPSTHTWKVGAYQVRFAAGPHKYLPEGGQRSFSTFAVTFQKEGQVPVREVATSGVDIETFAYTPDLKITEFMKVFVSPSERCLLITEDVPNDGQPCSNYILFELLGEELKVSYLKMPTWLSPGKLLEFGSLLPVRYYPVIHSLTDEEVEFAYLDQKPKRLRLQDIPRAGGVSFP